MGSFRHHAVAAVLALGFAGTHLTAFAQLSGDAKAALADGDRAAKAKDWTTAARFYDAANKTTPSAEALDGLANAQYQGGNVGDAYGSYSEWLGRYGAKASAAKKTAADARLRELGAKTGSVNVTVNEVGATILVDENAVGTSPLASPLRVGVGAHKLKVTKDGFAPFEQALTVTANGATALNASLTVTATKGKVAVKEQSGKAVRILVDGVDMGEAPWSGELDPGQHEIGARATGLVAAPQRITIERGKTEEITLTASSSSAPVKIGTSDGKGLIYLDGKLVGEGSFATDIPAGPHKLHITRDGYDPFDEDVTVKDKEPYSRTITLKISSAITTGPVAKDIERLEGVYGGISLLAMFTPRGTRSSIQTDCDSQSKVSTLASCSTPSGFGGGIGGYVGYSWDPVGLELFAAIQYDQRTLKNDWNAASTDPGFGPDPARYESFNLRRIGGMLVPRIRGQWTFNKIRVALAAGAGIDYRAMHLERTTTSKTPPVQHDTYSSNTLGYWSPVVSIEPSIGYRLSKGLTLQVGAQVFFDAPATFLNGKNDPKTNPESTHALGLRGLATPAYTLATDLQVFVGPFLGLQFGP